ncbi:unnamed protein product [Prorocentrum cordatum]|uniref:Uncharacterized protein n=1 Tax=Prorocentrum cordatum TaxID=2364126 RepID=A0ABN9TEB3_9DINO|nr:unnamed protein product [Polarella glacialis]
MLRRLLLPEVSPELTLKQQLQSQAQCASSTATRWWIPRGGVSLIPSWLAKVPQLFPVLRGVITVLVVCLGTLFFGQGPAFSVAFSVGAGFLGAPVCEVAAVSRAREV